MSGRYRLTGRAHANRVAAPASAHSDFRRRLIIGPRKLHVHTFPYPNPTFFCGMPDNLAKTSAVYFAHIGKALPQFINILKGDMSLVGPRPEQTKYVEEFREKIPRYMIKHQVRPGLTGWAQVNGYRGDTSIRKRIEHDLYYIENWTLGFDLKILFLTFFKGFVNKNAY